MKNLMRDPFKKLYLFIILLFLYAPIVVMMIFSFNESKQIGHWTGFSLNWYKQLFNDSELMSALGTTLLVALLASVIATVVGTVTAIGLHDYGKFSKSLIMNITYVPIVNPDIITGLSLMLLFMFVQLKLGLLTMLIAHVVFCIPYVIFSVMPKLRQVNFSRYEAAQDLGATPFQALCKVIIPELLPGIISGFMLSFTLSIDDFVVSFFTTGNGVTNLSTMVYTMTKRGINPKLNALSTIMFLTVLVLLIAINLYQNRGKKKREASITAAHNEELEFELQNSKTQNFSIDEERK